MTKQEPTDSAPTSDPIIWRSDLQIVLNRCSATIRRWIDDGTLPQPDINPTRKCVAWRLSTLRNAGFNIPWPR